MPKPNPFRAWLRSRPLAEMAERCDVSKTTIREWYTGRAHPHILRHDWLKRLAARDSVTLTTDHLLPARKP